MEGVIKNLVKEKGFGFITIEGEAKDLFFHKNSLVAGLSFEDLNIGDRVSFDKAESPKGPNAINVAIA
ncbi:MAG: cold-shock protein [Candidatus Nealsonbacteria bacterium CG_4_8_14_3_um_filter_39_7]|uniref:Cold-shock protein n=1 Tax=Candidatus Nealsonbacteria bacterium CG23_combo_of_CG06-09_8_20_14_all_39_17 TaxID=1974722 RepID=A0A2G9YUB2_9BACT|nr:MAG: cold-shock protein [Candidatus Nealsonbacteria bacterium CG23_combo_of_CG06-09_8_20_14_all_39_17]PIU44015.1 MAG: cold-shock protein [Candidatus Nealsonbacteria bacterium CG07_land_8_20_14_0_80_39_13]PIW91061.1 MAG: cold-shock protein [Candidatus Nealsonbacteria bacterium CG_4_8_14_3_um_filter_39_7]